MEQMLLVLSIGLLLPPILLPATATERSNCALTVKVLSPDGQDVVAPVVVEEENGRVVEKVHRRGGASFCDLGILPVTVKVGGDGTCSQTIVRNVRLNWGEALVLKTIYNYEPCLRDPPASPVPMCEVLFRVSDKQTKWISHARLLIQGKRPIVLTTDDYGRALLNARRDVSYSGSVSAGGFESAGFQVSCTAEQPRVERLLTLTREH